MDADRTSRDTGGAPEGIVTPPTVLLISDDPDPDTLRRLYGGGGALDITVADAVASAMELLDGTKSFDAVLLDLRRVDASGIEALARLRQALPQAPVIALTMDGEVQSSRHLKVDDWIGRLDPPPTILRCVRSALELRRVTEALQLRSAQLAESEARFSSIIQRSADGLVIVAGDGRVRFVNLAAEKMFGRSAAELVGQEFGHPVMAGETTEIDIVRREGEDALIAELRVSPTTWEGEPATVISLRDITDRKRSEERAHRLLLERAAREQAEKARERFRFLAEAGAILDSSLDPEATLTRLASVIVPRVADWCVVDLLEGSRIRRAVGLHADPGKQPLIDELTMRYAPAADSPHPAARVLRTGAPELYREMDADRLRDLTVDSDHAALLASLGVRSGIILPLETREHRLGVMTFVRSDRDFNDADLALATEIATRAARALDNSRLYEAAVEANRAKSDFLAVMSHELRTPLNAILGYAELLELGVGAEVDRTRHPYLQRIHSSAMQLLQIIDEILTFAHSEAGRVDARPEEFQLRDLVEEVVAIAEPLAREKGLEFRLEMPDPDPTLRTDRRQIRQIMLNLLTNAVKFTDEGSVGLRLEIAGEELVIRVSDTGRGIEEAALERIFEPFYQVEQGITRRTGGTGLGLAVSRRLAHLLGGDVQVESTPGRGSTFTVRLSRRLRPA